MNDIAIRIEGISKLYRIGHYERHKTLRESLTNAAKRPFQLVQSFVRNEAKQRVNKDTIWALKDISFEVKYGEVVGIIGSNGSGKSTLLKILSRITEPTEGRVEGYGRVGSLLEVGTGFHHELTGRENIYLNGAILGMKKAEIERKFDAIVAFSGINKFLDTPVKHYSSGMYVRLAFSVAAHLEPDILIVDEVLAVGDAAFQKKCLGKMEEVASEGRTVLFVSHNMAAIQALCSRGIFLQNGSVYRDDTACKAIDTYLQSLELASSQALTSRIERSGKGQMRLSRIDICSSDVNTSTSIATGSPLKFIFHLTAILPGLKCVFTIYDHLGQAVTHFNSAHHSPQDSSDFALDKKIICELSELLLVPGRYRINVAIYSNEELQDHVEAAAIFEVKQGTIRVDNTGYGSVFLHHHWNLPCGG